MTGLSLSFILPVDLILTPVRNLLHYGWIVSTTGQLTLNKKGLSNIDSGNKWLQPLITACRVCHFESCRQFCHLQLQQCTLTKYGKLTNGFLFSFIYNDHAHYTLHNTNNLFIATHLQLRLVQCMFLRKLLTLPCGTIAYTCANGHGCDGHYRNQWNSWIIALIISGDAGIMQWQECSAVALGSIPGPGVTCGLSLLLVLVPAPRFFSGFSGFPPSTKTNTPNSNLIWNWGPQVCQFCC